MYIHELNISKKILILDRGFEYSNTFDMYKICNLQ